MGLVKRLGNFVTFGAIDRHDAKQIMRNAQNKEENTKEELEAQRSKTQQSLESLGKKKIEIYTSSLSDFSDKYEKIGKVDLKPMKENDESFSAREFKSQMVEIKKVSTDLKEIGATLGGGALASVAATGLTTFAVSSLGVASTGTAIGTLTGAAASKATLAFLGGGAISAGGAGVAGGMAVIGGIVLAPLAIFGMFMGAHKGKQKLNAMKNYRDEVDVLIEKIKTLIAEIYQIQKCTDLINKTLRSLDALFIVKLSEMEPIVQRLKNRPIYQKLIIDPIKKIFHIDLFSEDEKQVIVETANCAKIIKSLIDIPILNEEGAFMSEAFSLIEKKQSTIDTMMDSNNLPAIEKG